MNKAQKETPNRGCTHYFETNFLFLFLFFNLLDCYLKLTWKSNSVTRFFSSSTSLSIPRNPSFLSPQVAGYHSSYNILISLIVTWPLWRLKLITSLISGETIKTFLPMTMLKQRQYEPHLWTRRWVEMAANESTCQESWIHLKLMQVFLFMFWIFFF